MLFCGFSSIGIGISTITIIQVTTVIIYILLSLYIVLYTVLLYIINNHIKLECLMYCIYIYYLYNINTT